MATTQKISSNLWFDNQAEEAANYYVSVFKNSKLGAVARYGKVGYEQHKQKEGTVMTVEFTLDGHDFIALNGGPIFKFSEAVSFVINCDTQEEIDYYWEKLSDGGDKQAQVCGWLKDRFGLSWQVVPSMMSQWFAGGPTEKTERAMGAMLEMKKLDIAALQAAYDGK
ncbi:MAG: VOC family protein [Chitinophagaceae bacterium]|nr:MAG: VOC family protein [Chitinophagaceae bacterium]